MEPFKLLVSQEKAEEIVLENCTPIEDTESVKIEASAGRVLAVDVRADRSVPPFDRSAMDGYAVIAKDTFGADTKEVLLRLDGVIHAGEVSDVRVSGGRCIQIATGSPLPEGADSVVMVEYTEKRGDEILITRPVYPGANVSNKGEDIVEGDVVLEKGTFLTPAKTGTLAALGLTEIEVYSKPRVAVIPTGKEIVSPGEQLAPGQIYDINSYTLLTVLEKHGVSVEQFPVAADEIETLKEALTQGLEYDMVVLSGGSSVGEKDLLAGILTELGEVLFHGVQIKPGKPTLFGIVNNTPVFGMPGYPTSCLSNAYIFLVPAVRKMARLPSVYERTVTAKIGKRIVSSSGRRQFLTVRLEGDVAHPVYKHSGAITSMAQADGYVILPVNLDVIEEGESIEVILLD
ncbi:MAG: molybdopterin molybdotransferase MoeA [Candidatus Thorarchaeota archaeon]|nr:MAG: molybdopterin molybdotransferase MoeA [Candidatus Thorarchaeota archaeon]